jgi:predicted esterase
MKCAFKSFLAGVGLVFLLCVSNQAREISQALLDPQIIQKWADNYNQAMQAYQQKDYERAIELLQNYLSHNYDDALAHYNLACCYGLTGQPEPATDYLTFAFQYGFQDYIKVLTDPDFDAVRNRKPFMELWSRIQQQTAAASKEIYLPSQSLVLVQVQLPDNFDPGESYPLLIGLHGNGGNAAEMMGVWNKFDGRKFIYVTPEGNYPVFNRSQAVIGHTWGFTGQNTDLWLQADQLVTENIKELIEYFAQHFKLRSVFLLGFSQGVAYSYMTAILHTDLIQGLICFAGILPDPGQKYTPFTEADLQRANSLQVFIAHGSHDASIAVEKSYQAHDRLKQLGYSVYFKEFQGGHEIDTRTLQQAEKWMIQQSIKK